MKILIAILLLTISTQAQDTHYKDYYDGYLIGWTDGYGKDAPQPERPQPPTKKENTYKRGYLKGLKDGIRTKTKRTKKPNTQSIRS